MRTRLPNDLLIIGSGSVLSVRLRKRGDRMVRSPLLREWVSSVGRKRATCGCVGSTDQTEMPTLPGYQSKPGMGTPKTCASSTKLSASTITEPMTAAACVSRPLTNSPMMSRRPVNITSAIIGTGSTSDRIT